MPDPRVTLALSEDLLCSSPQDAARAGIDATVLRVEGMRGGVA